jgi:ferredoxin
LAPLAFLALDFFPLFFRYMSEAVRSTQEIQNMPKLEVEDVGTFEVAEGKRLVNALTDDAKIDQLHACGGNARCTTCRVQFVAGEPSKMTQAEKELLELRGLKSHAGLRLSCQIVCDHDMTLRAISRQAGSGRSTPGNRPADDIQPPPVWT